MEHTIYRLERATRHDDDFLFRLLKATMEHSYLETYGTWDDAVERQYLQENIREWGYHLILHDEQKIGCLSFKHDDRELFLNEIQIFPHYQRKGIGTSVLQDLIDMAQSLGLPMKLEVLKVNRNAQRLYRRLNFLVCGETDTHYHMIRHCLPPE